MTEKNTKPLTVCYFGVNDKISKNSMTLKRLKQQNINVVDVWAQNKITDLNSEKHLGNLALIKRLLTKIKIIPEILKHSDRIRMSDVIFVGYPGHFDLPIAWVVSKFFHKPLIFDQVTFLVNTLADDVGIMKRQSLLARLTYTAEKFVYSLPDILLVDSQVLGDYIHEEFGVPSSKIKVVYLGADEEIYKFQGFKKPGKVLNVIYYGMYNPIHGVEHIVAAARKLSTDANIQFTMIGTGPLYPMAYELAQKYKLKNIQFFPSMPEADAQKLLKEADIFLGFMQNLSSADRFIPNKVGQGIALGKAVITSRTKVIESVFTDQENIYMCLSNNSDSLVKAITDLKTHPLLLEKIAQNGYKLFNEKFSMRQVGIELTKIMRSVS